MRALRHVVIGVILACALNSEGADYAGWTVGKVWNGYGTILRSTDSGVSWTRQGTGQLADTSLEGISTVDPLTAWVVGDSNAGYATIYHTTDGGLTWDRKGSLAQVPDTALLKVTTFGDNNVWAVGTGTILHSSDGGASWANQIPTGYESIHLQGVYTPDGVNVWATGGPSGSYATILKSGDGGLNWTRQSGGDVGILDHVLGISAVDATTAWAMGATNGSMRWSVLGTTDGGVNWTEQNHGGLDGNNVYAVDASTVWAVSDDTIQRTTNGGASWDGSSSQCYTMGISAVDSQQAWAVSLGLHGAIYHTTDGGNNWVTLTQLGGETLPGLQTVSFSREVIPEPSSAALLAVGLAAMPGRSRRRSR
ncbi:MAG: YCF48-related protein [Verrucomicrobia bacterium]|nr:YCF48-related protein [Verrucomicrobiota bacterium]